MSKQKEEAERFKRVNITIDPVIHQKATDKADVIRLSLSTLISDLLSLWIDGKIELNGSISAGIEHIHTGVYPIHTEEMEEFIKSRISAEVEPLRKKIEELQSAKQYTSVCSGVHQKLIIDESPEDQTQSSPQKPVIEVSPVAPMEVSPAPVSANSEPGNEGAIKKPVLVRNSRLNKHYEGDAKAFVQSFRAWLKDNGFTQAKFEETYEFSLSAIGKWERGERPLPLDKYESISGIMKGEIAPPQ